MIRVLLPKSAYNLQRLRLVERVTPFFKKKFSNVKRAHEYLELAEDFFYEGFLGNERLLNLVQIMLSDNPIFVRQDSEVFPDVKTILIEDGMEVEIPY